MLNEHGLAHRYREYTKEALSADEIRRVLAMLGMGARDVMRAADAKKLGVPADADDDAIITLMTEHPKLLQRPIGIKDGRAELGRPIENLLRLG